MAKIKGQLEDAQLHNKSSDPSAGRAGAVWINTTSGLPKIDDGSSIHQIVTHDQTQTLTNKTVVVSSNTITTASSGNLAATELNAALAELQGDIDTRATASDLSTHISDTTTHGTTGDIVGTSDTQTLTNKKVGLQDGASASDLALYFTDDTNTGVYSPSNDKLDIVAGGYVGVEVGKSTGNFANVGMGSSASASDNYPLLIQRSNTSTGTIAQISNPDTAASSKATFQLAADSGANTGEVSVFTAATTTDAYAGRMTVRPSDSTAGLSLIGGDTASGDIRFYTGGDYTSTGRALQVNADKSLQFMQQISTPSTPASGSKIYFKSDGKPYYLGTVGVETQFGSGSGGINYLSANPDAESSTTGWATYADAAGTSPVDGTGGSPNSTWTRTTSSPLRGSGSFLLTKDAANRQGEGASYDLTIDAADRGMALQVSFDYAIASGTYADGDLTVYLIEDPSGTPVVIQPTPYTILNTSVNSRWQGTFQTSTSVTSYRLVIHVASTSASAYTVKFDNFYVGPQTKSYGPFISDATAYTPTISNLGTGSTAANGAYYRRVGDSLEVSGYFVKDGSGGSGTGTAVTISIPSGLTIDTAKIPGTAGQLDQNIGAASILSGATRWEGTTQYYSTTAVGLLMYDGTTGDHAVVGADVVANARVGYSFKVPITGWSSGQLLSSDAETRVLSTKTYRTSSTQSLSNATPTKIQLNATSFDKNGTADITTNYRITVAVPGVYDIKGSVSYAANATGVRYCMIYKNGSQIAASTMPTAGAGDASIVQCATELDLIAGDYIELYGSQSSGGSLNVNTGVDVTYLSVSKKAGPSQIAASEEISFSVHTSTTAASTSAPFIYTSTYSNSHGAYSTSTGIFTAPAPGRYFFGASVYVGASSSTIFMYKNGTSIAQGIPVTGTPNGSAVTAILVLNTGDTVEVRPDASVTATGGANLNRFYGFKIGR